MSKVRTYGIVFLALLLVWLTACIRDAVMEDDLKPAHVRVQTTVKIGFVQPATRASGDVEEVAGSYTETTDKGDPFDSKIASMRVLAFSEGVLKINKLYSSGVNYNEGSTYYEDQFGKETVGTDTTYYMDIELMPGQYQLYLIANENNAWTSGLSALQLETATLNDIFAIPSMQATDNNIFTAYWYRYLPEQYFIDAGLPVPTVEPKGIPMVGVAENLNIVPGATYDNPTPIYPSIELKRTLAKLEVYLKNTDNNGDLHPNAARYQFKDVELSGFNRAYNVFYGYNPSATMPIGSSNLSISIPVHTYDEGTGDYTYHQVGEPYHKAGDSKLANRAFYSYLAEYQYPLNFLVHAEKLGETISYEIPIYQYVNSEKDYTIRRNHLYRIYCTLQGSGVIQVKYAVGDWEFKNLETVLGYGFQLVLDGNQLNITNTMQACDPHTIKLQPLGETTLTIGGVTYKETDPTNKYAVFNKTENGATDTYTLANIPASGDYLKVYYNDNVEPIKTFTK